MSPTDLYMVRHGIAEDENPDHPEDDGARRLTQRGRNRAKDAAFGMRRIGVSPDVIWTSPLPRARETAEILAEILRPPEGLIETESLAFGTSASALISELAESSADRLMIVGHNPMFNDVLSELVAAGRLRVHLKKASLAHVSFHAEGTMAGELVMCVPPRLLRAIGD